MTKIYTRAVIYYAVNSAIAFFIIFISNRGNTGQIALHLFGGQYDEYSYTFYILGWIYFLSGLIVACGASLTLLSLLHKKQDLNTPSSKKKVGDAISGVFSILIGVGILEKLV